MIPFIGTALGSLAVFFMKNSPSDSLSARTETFAAGIMVAASVYSLLIPSFELSADMGKLAFIPPLSGLIAGSFLIPLCEKAGALLKLRVRDGAVLTAAVVIHNIPEGMAVGAALASFLAGGCSSASALALSTGIAVQNVPEGAVISFPAAANGKKKGTAAVTGVLSGAAEPIAGALTLAASDIVLKILPFTLSFAAGAMLYAVFAEMLPGAYQKDKSKVPATAFIAGFSLMMVLDSI